MPKLPKVTFGAFDTFGTGIEEQNGALERVLSEWTAGILRLLSLSRKRCIKPNETARIRTSSGTLLTYYRRPRTGTVLLWKLR